MPNDSFYLRKVRDERYRRSLGGEISVLKEVIQIMAIYRMFPEVVARLADLVQYKTTIAAQKKKREGKGKTKSCLLSFFIFFGKHR